MGIFEEIKNALKMGLPPAPRATPRATEVLPIRRASTTLRSVRWRLDRAAAGALAPTEPRKIAIAAKTFDSNSSISRSVYGPVISADSLAQGVGGGRGSKKSKIENPYG